MSRGYRANAISGILGKKGKYTKQQLEESLKNREHSIQERRKRRKQAAKRAGN